MSIFSFVTRNIARAGVKTPGLVPGGWRGLVCPSLSYSKPMEVFGKGIRSMLEWRTGYRFWVHVSRYNLNAYDIFDFPGTLVPA